jgi:hypothetical protein
MAGIVYYRSTEQLSSNVLKTFPAAGIEFALLQDLFFTLSSYYQNQQGSDIASIIAINSD